MPWEPILWKSGADEYIEITIFEKEGLRLKIWRGDEDRSTRMATIPWKEWEKLAAMVKVHHP